MLRVDHRGQGYKLAAWLPVIKCLLTAHSFPRVYNLDKDLPSLGFLTWSAGVVGERLPLCPGS